MGNLEPNRVVRMDGFNSTSTDPGRYSSYGKSDVLMEIRPKRGAYIDRLSATPGEQEFLMRDGIQLRFIAKKDVELPGGRTRTVYQFEEVTDAPVAQAAPRPVETPWPLADDAVRKAPEKPPAKWGDRLNADESDSIFSYTTVSDSVNTSLRDGDFDRVADEVKSLRKAIAKSPPENVPPVTFRVIDADPDVVGYSINDMRIGDTITDRAFMSTTPDPDDLFNFLEYAKKHDDYAHEAIMEIVPRVGAAIKGVLPIDFNEFLMRDSSKLRFVGKKRVTFKTRNHGTQTRTVYQFEEVTDAKIAKAPEAPPRGPVRPAVGRDRVRGDVRPKDRPDRAGTAAADAARKAPDTLKTDELRLEIDRLDGLLAGDLPSGERNLLLLRRDKARMVITERELERIENRLRPVDPPRQIAPAELAKLERNRAELRQRLDLQRELDSLLTSMIDLDAAARTTARARVTDIRNALDTIYDTKPLTLGPDQPAVKFLYEEALRIADSRLPKAFGVKVDGLHLRAVELLRRAEAAGLDEDTVKKLRKRLDHLRDTRKRTPIPDELNVDKIRAANAKAIAAKLTEEVTEENVFLFTDAIDDSVKQIDQLLRHGGVEVTDLRADRALLEDRFRRLLEHKPAKKFQDRVSFQTPGFDASPDVAKGIDKFSRFVDPRLNLHDVGFGRKKARPSALRVNKNYTEISFDEDISTSQFVHELGHALEHTNDDLFSEAVKFLGDFTRGKGGIREFTGASKLDGEYFFGFRQKYTGRIYFDTDAPRTRLLAGKHISATEVVSNGLEQMARNPVKFARDEPEHFQFILRHVMRRDLLDKKAIKRASKAPSPEDLHAKSLETDYERWAGELPEDEIYAFSTYTKSAEVINKYLRGVKDIPAGVRKGRVDKVVSDLRESLARAKDIEKPDRVWRVIDPENAPWKAGKLSLGETITDKGFQSTTVNLKIATEIRQEFMRQDLRPVVMEIRPKHGAYIDGVSNYKGLQHEFLIPDNTQLRFTGTKDVTHGSTRYRVYQFDEALPGEQSFVDDTGRIVVYGEDRRPPAVSGPQAAPVDQAMKRNVLDATARRLDDYVDRIVKRLEQYSLPSLRGEFDPVATLATFKADLAKVRTSLRETLGDDFQDKLRDMLSADRTGVYMAVKDSTLGKLIKDGQFRSSIETGKGSFKKIGRERFDKIEHPIFGVPEEALENHDLMPKYAFLAGRESMDYDNVIGFGYGDNYIKFKPHVRDRATFTLGDSFNGNSNLITPASPLNEPTQEALLRNLRLKYGKKNDYGGPGDPIGYEYDRIDEVQEALGSGDYKKLLRTLYAGQEYVEVQLYGRLTLADVSEIAVESKKSAAKLRKALDKAGYEDIAVVPSRYNSRLKRIDDVYLDSAESLSPSDIDRLGDAYIDKVLKAETGPFAFSDVARPSQRLSYAETVRRKQDRDRLWKDARSLVDVHVKYDHDPARFYREASLADKRSYLKDYYARKAISKATKGAEGGLPKLFWEKYRPTQAGFTADVMDARLLRHPDELGKALPKKLPVDSAPPRVAPLDPPTPKQTRRKLPPPSDNPTPESIAAYVDEIDAAEEAVRKRPTYDLLDEAKDRKADFAEHIARSDDVAVRIQERIKKTPKIIAEVDAFSRFTHLVDPKLKLRDIHYGGQKPRATAVRESNRTTIWYSDDVATSTIVHELGHAIEHSDDGLFAEVVEFLNKRAKGKGSNLLANGDGAYLEAGFKKKYTGRIYDRDVDDRYELLYDGTRVRSTEVVSMGLQQMAMDPYKFFKEDREFFDFILNHVVRRKDWSRTPRRVRTPLEFRVERRATTADADRLPKGSITVYRDNRDFPPRVRGERLVANEDIGTIQPRYGHWVADRWLKEELGLDDLGTDVGDAVDKVIAAYASWEKKTGVLPKTSLPLKAVKPGSSYAPVDPTKTAPPKLRKKPGTKLPPAPPHDVERVDEVISLLTNPKKRHDYATGERIQKLIWPAKVKDVPDSLKDALTGRRYAVADDAVREFARLVPPHLLPTLKKVTLKRDLDLGSRAHAVPEADGSVTIHYTGTELKNIFLHEFGHALELSSDEIFQDAVRYLNKRTKPVYKKLPMTDEPYRPGFTDAYAGRIYTTEELLSTEHRIVQVGRLDDGVEVGATEIVSVGLEHMTGDPVMFYHSDPEFFEFMLRYVIWRKPASGQEKVRPSGVRAPSKKPPKPPKHDAASADKVMEAAKLGEDVDGLMRRPFPTDDTLFKRPSSPGDPLNRGLDAFLRLVPPHMRAQMRRLILQDAPGGRSAIVPLADGRISLRFGTGASSRDVVHALGHALELSNASLFRDAVRFVDRVTVATYRNLPVTGERYRPGFADMTVGRSIPPIPIKVGMYAGYQLASLVDGTQVGATEVVSLGLENMATDPLGFYNSDPEFFEFILRYVVWREQ